MMAATFAYVTMFLAKIKVKNWIVLSAFIFFALCPVNAIFSFTTTKDITATLALLLFAIFLIKLMFNPQKFFHSIPEIAGLIGFGVLSCLLRNNMIYAMILFLPIIVFVMGRRHVKFVLIYFGLMVALVWAITGPFYSALGIIPGRSKEALSVPMQQIANAVVNNDDKITVEERAQIGKYIDSENIKSIYNPRFSDPIKDTFQEQEFDKNSIGFFNIWGELFEKYPGDYIDAFLSLNLPYWYIDAPFPDRFAQREYIETSTPHLPDIVRPKIFAPWHDFIDSIAEFRSVINTPLLSNLFSMSLPIWILYFSAVILMFKKKSRLISVFTPAALLWVTYMAGPVSNMRYVFPLFVLYPVLLALVFLRNESMVKDKADE
jgi:hypothetical protein